MNDTATVPATADDPRIKPVAKEVATLTEQVKTLEIATADDYERGAAILMTIKGALKSHEEQRKKITNPLDEAKKQVMDLFRPFATALTNAEKSLKKRLTDWSDEQDRIAAEQARIAQEKADKERAKLEQQAEQAESKGRGARAEILRDRAASAVAAVPITTAPKVAGLSKRKTYKHRIVDAAKVPEKYKIIDNKRIAGVVRALGKDADIPGIEVYEESSLAAGAAR